MSEESLKEYADTLMPCVYDDFVLSAKRVLTPTHKKGAPTPIEFQVQETLQI